MKKKQKQGHFKSRHKKYTQEKGFIYKVKWEKHTSLKSVFT